MQITKFFTEYTLTVQRQIVWIKNHVDFRRRMCKFFTAMLFFCVFFTCFWHICEFFLLVFATFEIFHIFCLILCANCVCKFSKFCQCYSFSFLCIQIHKEYYLGTQVKCQLTLPNRNYPRYTIWANYPLAITQSKYKNTLVNYLE